MNYEQALEYIHGVNWTFCKPGLERIGHLCEALGHPERDMKFVHVAGTNGKGSFSSMLSQVLLAAGYRVGLYTSPYVIRFNERMKINGEDISDSELAEIVDKVKPVADAMTDKPTEFELITAIAFLYFKRHNADVVVLEAGMGGRLDSTNIIESAALSVITGIALDHTAFLGDTVEKIAVEKAGIIKHGCPVLFGGRDKSALRVIADRAEQMGSELVTVTHSEIAVKRADLDGSVIDYGGFCDVRLSLLGLYQPMNTASVIEAVGVLNRRGFSISEEQLRLGLSTARWPARFEILSREPLVIFDGAHNPEGISGAVASIKHYFPATRVYAVSGVLRDKDYRFIAGELASVCSRVYTITPDNSRALSNTEYAAVLSEYGVEAIPCTTIGEAVANAFNAASEDGVPVVCLGSLYTYADVTKELSKQRR